MDKINIVTALNKKYLLYTGVMLFSLCINNKKPIRAFLLHSELDENDIQLLKHGMKNLDIEIVPLKVDSDMFDARLPRNQQWTIETYYRLMLLELLPSNVERLLYIDVDIIINKSIDEVYHIDFKDKEIIAAEDPCVQRNWNALGDKQREMFAPMFQQGYKYFNAGFMLLNIKELRKKYSFETYMQAIETWNYQMGAPDQDILNYVHWQNIGYIDSNKYDLFARIAHNEGLTYEQVKRDITIIHYAGEKPWNADNCHYDIEYLWWDYAKQTPFYLQLLEEFLHKSMFDSTMENYIKELMEQSAQTQQQLQESMALNQKFLSILQNGK